MELRDFCGNGRTVAALGELFRQGRLPHALCLEGEDGTGKKTLARLCAGAALCTAPQGERPCGRCLACDKVERGIHPDVLVLTGGKGSRSFHVDSIRRLRQEAYLAPNEGRVKVFLLLDAHTMTVQAQNALLKVIEDPPQASLFVLTVRSRRQLLPTILSRVVTFSLEAPSPEDCARRLEQLCPGKDPAACRAAAQEAWGNVGEALLLLEGGEKRSPNQEARRLLEKLARGDEYGALAMLVPYEKDRPGLDRLLERLVTVAQQSAIVQDPARRVVTPAQAVVLEELCTQAARMNGQNVSVPLLAAVFCGQAAVRL